MTATTRQQAQSKDTIQGCRECRRGVIIFSGLDNYRTWLAVLIRVDQKWKRIYPVPVPTWHFGLARNVPETCSMYSIIAQDLTKSGGSSSGKRSRATYHSSSCLYLYHGENHDATVDAVVQLRDAVVQPRIFIFSRYGSVESLASPSLPVHGDDILCFLTENASRGANRLAILVVINHVKDTRQREGPIISVLFIWWWSCSSPLPDDSWRRPRFCLGLSMSMLPLLAPFEAIIRSMMSVMSRHISRIKPAVPVNSLDLPTADSLITSRGFTARKHGTDNFAVSVRWVRWLSLSPDRLLTTRSVIASRNTLLVVLAISLKILGLNHHLRHVAMVFVLRGIRCSPSLPDRAQISGNVLGDIVSIGCLYAVLWRIKFY